MSRRRPLTQEVIERLQRTIVVQCDDSSHVRGKINKIQTFVHDETGWQPQFDQHVENGIDGVTRHRLRCKLCRRNGYYRTDTIEPALTLLLDRGIHEVNLRALQMVITQIGARQ